MSDENHGHDHGHSHPHTHSYTHAHDHDHGGDHEHNHDHAHECNHGHDHGDGHTHSHEHDHDQGGDLAKLRALLKYMLDHNREHTGELGDLAHNLFHAGQGESADSIHEAVKDFESGNEKLAKALALIKDGK